MLASGAQFIERILMNRESIELRIDELNVQRKVLVKKALDLKKRIHEVDGRIAERWDELNSWKERGEYGYRTLEEGVRVMKVPKFKTQEEMQQALEGKEAAIGGVEKKATLQAREARAREDAQRAINVLDGNSPIEDIDGNDNR
jgi:hypothetical protein